MVILRNSWENLGQAPLILRICRREAPGKFLGVFLATFRQNHCQTQVKTWIVPARSAEMFRGPSTLAKDLGTIPHNSCKTCAGHLQSNCQTIPGHYKNYFQDYSNTSPKHVKHFETRLQTIAKTTLKTVFTNISKLFHRPLLKHPKTVSRQFPKHFQGIPITFPKTCTAHPKKLPKLISNTLPKHLHSMSKT